jgi:hypothetical protein
MDDVSPIFILQRYKSEVNMANMRQIVFHFIKNNNFYTYNLFVIKKSLMMACLQSLVTFMYKSGLQLKAKIENWSLQKKSE